MRELEGLWGQTALGLCAGDVALGGSLQISELQLWVHTTWLIIPSSKGYGRDDTFSKRRLYTGQVT